MPIFIKFDGVKGRVDSAGHDFARAGGATGGVWKTTNFLSADPSGATVSSISLGGRWVDAEDGVATVKAAELFEAARVAPGGRLYVATDAGVYNNRGQLLVGVDKVKLTTTYDAKGRLVVGTDGGVWRSGAAATAKRTNNLSQLGIAAHQTEVVEIVVSDRGSVTGRVFRLRNVTFSQGPAGTTAINFTGLE